MVGLSRQWGCPLAVAFGALSYGRDLHKAVNWVRWSGAKRIRLRPNSTHKAAEHVKHQYLDCSNEAWSDVTEPLNVTQCSNNPNTSLWTGMNEVKVLLLEAVAFRKMDLCIKGSCRWKVTVLIGTNGWQWATSIELIRLVHQGTSVILLLGYKSYDLVFLELDKSSDHVGSISYASTFMPSQSRPGLTDGTCPLLPQPWIDTVSMKLHKTKNHPFSPQTWPEEI